MDIDKIRSQIPTCQRMSYLNTGWSGPSPARVVEAMTKRLEYESYEGPTSQPVLESGEKLRQETREAVARLLNVSPTEVALTQNTTEGMNMVMSGFPWREGDEIITFDIEHPSVMVPCLYAQRRHGVQVRSLLLGTNDDWDTVVSKVEEALNPKTRMLVFSHIQFACGLRMPLDDIRRLTKDRGIYMLVDGAQTPGHISLDLAASGVDFYSIPAQKWLLGPDGAGALYIGDELIETIQPSYVGHSVVDMSKNPWEFDFSSMDKFRVSTTSSPIAAGLLEAITFIQEIGIDEIEARNIELSSALKAKLLDLPGFRVLSPLEGPGVCGLTSFSIDGADPKEMVQRLWEEEQIVARPVARPESIRISSDFFNTEDELEKLVVALQRIRG